MPEKNWEGSKIRLRTDPETGETIITNLDGKPVEFVTKAFFRQEAGDRQPTVALEFLVPEVDVIGDVATFDRLNAAEKACREAERMLWAVRRDWERHRDRAAAAELPPRPGLLPLPEPFRFANELAATLDAWRATAGLPPLKD